MCFTTYVLINVVILVSKANLSNESWNKLVDQFVFYFTETKKGEEFNKKSIMLYKNAFAYLFSK